MHFLFAIFYHHHFRFQRFLKSSFLAIFLPSRPAGVHSLLGNFSSGVSLFSDTVLLVSYCVYVSNFLTFHSQHYLFLGVNSTRSCGGLPCLVIPYTGFSVGCWDMLCHWSLTLICLPDWVLGRCCSPFPNL